MRTRNKLLGARSTPPRNYITLENVKENHSLFVQGGIDDNTTSTQSDSEGESGREEIKAAMHAITLDLRRTRGQQNEQHKQRYAQENQRTGLDRCSSRERALSDGTS